jgi:hypothetical protein
LIPCFWSGCVWEWRKISQTVQKKYTTLSTEWTVALQSVNNIFQQSYDFSASLEWKSWVKVFVRQKYYSQTRNKMQKDSVNQKNGMLLPNIASWKLSQVHVKFSGQQYQWESQTYNAIFKINRYVKTYSMLYLTSLTKRSMGHIAHLSHLGHNWKIFSLYMHYIFICGHYTQFHVMYKGGHCMVTPQAYTCALRLGISTVWEIIGHFLFKSDVHGNTSYGHDLHTIRCYLTQETRICMVKRWGSQWFYRYYNTSCCRGDIDWLFTVLRPAQEYFTYMETSPLTVKGCKI